jgi:hypothetical protein
MRVAGQILLSSVAACVLLLVCSSLAQAAATERVSLGPGGAQADGPSGRCAISGNGQFVIFESDATNLVSGDTNDYTDVFLRNRSAGTTELVSVDTSGGPADGPSLIGSVSWDGMYVAFYSWATDLRYNPTAGQPPLPDANDRADVFVRDVDADTTTLVSRDTLGTIGNSHSLNPALAVVAGSPPQSDQVWVAFESDATNLVGGDTNQASDVFLRKVAGSGSLYTVRVSVRKLVGQDPVQADKASGRPAIALSGAYVYVVFESKATNLVDGDNNNASDIFRAKVNAASGVVEAVERVSVSTSGTGANGECHYAAIDPTGDYVALQSAASNLVTNDTNNTWDIFLRKMTTPVSTTRVSVRTNGTQADKPCGRCAVSNNAGTVRVFFESDANNLIDTYDNNTYTDVFVRYPTGTIYLVSKNTSGYSGNGPSFLGSVSADGNRTAFYSWARDLVSSPPIPQNYANVYVRDSAKPGTYLASVSDESPERPGYRKNDIDDPAEAWKVAASIHPCVAVTADWIFTALSSDATNFVPNDPGNPNDGDSNGDMDVFLHQQSTGW